VNFGAFAAVFRNNGDPAVLQCVGPAVDRALDLFRELPADDFDPDTLRAI
jgi:hypothetical protein